MDGLCRHFIKRCIDWYSVLACNMYCVLVFSEQFSLPVRSPDSFTYIFNVVNSV